MINNLGVAQLIDIIPKDRKCLDYESHEYFEEKTRNSCYSPRINCMAKKIIPKIQFGMFRKCSLPSKISTTPKPLL